MNASCIPGAELPAAAPHAPRRHAWRGNAAAALVFMALAAWHLEPVLPSLAGATPDHIDMANNTVELLSTMRSLVRHPLSFSQGQHSYPYEHSNALLNSNYLAGIPYYLVYCLTGNPSLAYNALVLLVFFLNAYAVYLLVKLWSGSWLAGVTAGALCAFFPHRYHELAFYHYQMTFPAALVMYAWLLYLRNGKFAHLCLMFAVIVLKAVSIDYNTLFLLLVLTVIVPMGYLSYPSRLRSWWQVALLACATLPVILVFAHPYYVNFSRLVQGQWTFMATNLTFITWKDAGELFTGFLRNVTHPRTRLHTLVNAPILPGAVCIVLCAAAAAWMPVSLFFKGRERWLRLGLLVLAACAVLLSTTPAYIPRGGQRVFSPLARLHIDPPVLALIRFPRAYIFSIMLCLSVLVGIAIGDALAALDGRTRRIRHAAICIVVLLLALATLEHTVAIQRYAANVPRSAPGVYEWLGRQRKPSPFIEFPFPHGLASYSPVLNAVIADQPTALPLGRIFTQNTFFLKELGAAPSSDRTLAMLEASPYRFWVQHRADDAFRRRVEASSDLRYATNFGGDYVFENPRIERALPLAFSVTQHWALSFPHIYTIQGSICFTGLYSFVPRGGRPVRFDIECLDGDGARLATLAVRGGLPFMLAGPTNSFSITVQYDALNGRLRGLYRNSGHFNMERWPAATARCSDAILRTRTLRVNAWRRGKAMASAMLDVVPLTGRWPLEFGTPVVMPHLSGGWDQFEKDGAMPFQRSVGRASVVMNGRPDGVVTALVIVARAALTNVPGAMQAHVALNGVRLGTIPLDAQWRTNVLSAPGHCWRDANVIALSYPRTYHPCLVGEGYDTARRCAALAVIDAE